MLTPRPDGATLRGPNMEADMDERVVSLTLDEIQYILDELEFGGPVNNKEREWDESITAKLEAALKGGSGD